MNEPTTPRRQSKKPPSISSWWALAVIAIALCAGLTALFTWTPKVKLPQAIEGRPLLANEGELFKDDQVGLTFSPPPDWAMQARTTEAPGVHRAERMLVKYKQLVPGAPVAWLRVSIEDVSGETSPADLLRNKKPPESDWKVIKPVEDGLTLGGKPAARITFGGPFNPDGKGKRDFVSEVAAVRHRTTVLFFAGTFAVADEKSRQKVRAALESIRFVGG